MLFGATRTTTELLTEIAAASALLVGFVLGPDDGDIHIRAMSWDQWKAKSVG